MMYSKYKNHYEELESMYYKNELIIHFKTLIKWIE